MGANVSSSSPRHKEERPLENMSQFAFRIGSPWLNGLNGVLGIQGRVDRSPHILTRGCSLGISLAKLSKNGI